MTQEEKQLLLKDLCARLPYGVIVRVHDIEHNDFDSYVDNISNTCIETHPIDELTIPYVFYKLQDVKPYLRPMSSMTEEEKKEFTNLTDCDSITETGFGYNEGGTLEDYISSSPFKLLAIVMDWFNKHQFDYRGLIPMGLALPAKPGMYDSN